MEMEMYPGTRSILTFTQLVCWVIVPAGIFLAFYGYNLISGTGFNRNSDQVQQMLGAAPGLIIAFFGLVGAAITGVGVAVLDAAESAKEIERNSVVRPIGRQEPSLYDDLPKKS